MSQDANSFLSRWSQRKQAAREPVGDETPQDALIETAPQQPEKTDAEILEELGLKDPDDMAEGDDFSGFMSGAIPERLRNRALRKLWLTNPVLANLDELVDYGEDFTDAATVVENLQTAYRVGKGFLRQEEIDAAKAAEEADDESADKADDAVDSDETDVSDVETDPSQPDLQETESADATFPSDGTPSKGIGTVQQDVDSQGLSITAASLEAASTPADAGNARPRRMVFRTSTS